MRAIVQKWEESERGWGTRPDGYSLHASEADRAQFVVDYWKTMPDQPPDEYSRPRGTPYWAEIDPKDAKAVAASKNGVRRIGDPPGHGGVDGWVSSTRNDR